MSPAEEAAHIAEFFRDVYCSQGIYSPPDPAPINGITFTLQELEQAMRHLHPAKALPSSFVPAKFGAKPRLILHRFFSQLSTSNRLAFLVPGTKFRYVQSPKRRLSDCPNSSGQSPFCTLPIKSLQV